MWIILRSILHIASYCLSIYLLDYYSFLWWIDFKFVATTRQDQLKVYLLIWCIFWLWFSIIKKIVNIFAFPFRILTLWLIWFVINIFIFYLCQLLINTYLTGIEMKITSLTGLVFVSFFLSMLVSIFYWLLRKLV